MNNRKKLAIRAVLLALLLTGGIVALFFSGRQKKTSLSVPSGRQASARDTSAGDEGTAENEEQKSGTLVPEEAPEAEEAIPEEAPVEMVPDPYPGRPAVDTDSWEFILANPTHSVKEYEPKVAALEGIELDERIIPAMKDFVEAARAQGLSVVLASGYRGYAEQTWLFQEKVSEYGEERAETIVARPGTSEHQTGLAADITDAYYEVKKQELEYTDLYEWMSRHCQEYGFIVRYPRDKEDITGIIYEPWHFRYVGIPAATYIMEQGITLEEFLERYEAAGE
ncbi:MAG: M15 family metallopeptidase [Blautia sp.]|nr:M15 family metallopeptidase [Blautia sp.]